MLRTRCRRRLVRRRPVVVVVDLLLIPSKLVREACALFGVIDERVCIVVEGSG